MNFEDYYYIARNAYFYNYKDILDYLDQNPIIRYDFVYWFATLYHSKKDPSYHTVVNKLEELAYKHKIPTMALAYRYKRNYNDAFAGISDAEANAAADAALRQIAARKRPYRPTMINIRKPMLPRTNYTVGKIGELKGVDTSINVAAIPTTTNDNSAILPINLINQGSGSFNRVGRKVYPRSVRLTGQVNLVHKISDTYPGITDIAVRCVLIWDKQPNSSAVPAWQDIFGHTNALGTEATTTLDAIRYDNTQRFKILKEWIMKAPVTAVDETTSLQSLQSCIPFDEFYKFKKRDNFESTYSNTQTAPTPPVYTDISTGGLLFAYRTIVCDGAEASAYSVSATLANARYRYTD